MQAISSPPTEAERSEFSQRLVREGFLDTEVKTIEAGKVVGEHSHPFDVRALVLSGQATIDCGAGPRTYRPGDIVDVAANVVHTERYGPDGYSILVGRRHKPA
jgi:quercetin dioxygenase-like cupin family protein